MNIFLEKVKGTFWSIITLALCLTPLWIFLAVRGVANPEGFWQELALGALGAYFLVGFQIIGIAAWFFLLWIIWSYFSDNIRRIKKEKSRLSDDAWA